ncbi:glucokinase [Sphaerisporangium siamense]|uniref:Glucokinase/fructokinase n=1 Tax=Sphaerisporangium siamense TaxID=795645 RepID=A0A7W7DC13_9ACTN|nr:ROK family protein [Sphaerisporangium siamense]MBB4704040.1 glucokinase/fructokinase [Sphaerisporangium siamense]GII82515.1 glucokinase [Sphaerisporangium siamense]
MSHLYAGVDVGGTSVRVLTETAGVRGEPVAAPVASGYEEFLDQLAALLPAGPRAVTVGLPGTSAAGVPAFVPALPWLAGRPLAGDLAARAGAPVTLALDGHLTLLAEAAEGAAKGLRSAVLIAVGTGVGGALLVNGRIWRGAHGSAGSWGWLPTPVPPDPHQGPFERVAAGSTLPGGPALVAAARSGDGDALAMLDDYAGHLGRGIAALASGLDPDVVLVGGGMADAMDVLGPLLDAHVARWASPDGRRVPVRAAALGSRAGVVGALLAARRGEEW